MSDEEDEHEDDEEEGYGDYKRHERNERKYGIAHDISDLLTGTEYEPPKDPESREAYDKGWQRARRGYDEDDDDEDDW